MQNKEVFHAATLLMEQHGEGALLHAMQRVLEMRLAGDAVGERIWEGILDALVDMWTTEPAPGCTIH